MVRLQPLRDLGGAGLRQAVDIDPVLGTLASLATFGIGFVSRPIGALVFGHLGDRLGRKQVLVATMMIIGSATFLIGLLPDYHTIGLWAPALLVLLRLVQVSALATLFLRETRDVDVSEFEARSVEARA